MIVPEAPSLKLTVLLPAVGSKPKPLIVIVVAFAARLAVLVVTTGVTVGYLRLTAPLLTLSVVTTAVRLPAVVGLVVKFTVSEVAVAAVTVPTAPSLKTTVLLAAVVSKPKPLMVTVAALAARLARAAGHDRRDRGHLHGRAAAHAIDRNHGRSGCPRRLAPWRAPR